MACKPRAVDLEIYENPSIGDEHPELPIAPNSIRLNGVELMTPEDAPVTISGLADSRGARGKVLQATVTFFAHSVSTGFGCPKSRIDIGRPDGPSAAVVEFYDGPSAYLPGFPVKPMFVRVNGVDCVTTRPAEVRGLGDMREPCTVTMTFAVRSLIAH